MVKLTLIPTSNQQLPLLSDTPVRTKELTIQSPIPTSLQTRSFSMP